MTALLLGRGAPEKLALWLWMVLAPLVTDRIESLLKPRLLLLNFKTTRAVFPKKNVRNKVRTIHRRRISSNGDWKTCTSRKQNPAL